MQNLDDGVDEVYLQMLRDAGIDVPLAAKQNLDLQQQSQNICCGKLQDFVHEGNVVCYDCGKVFGGKSLIFYNSYNDQQTSAWGRCGQPNDGVEFKKKRYYKSSSHFREHLRRYLGCRVPVPDKAMQIIKLRIKDFNDPMAYFIVKGILKELKMPQYYRSIFTVIYACGGIKPVFSVQLLQQAEAQFNMLAFYFQQNRGKTQKFKRKSMPSMYMLLDLILRKCGHTPHYFIPQLKDCQLRRKVLDFFLQFDKDEFRCLGSERNVPSDTETLVSMYPDLPMLCDRLRSQESSTPISGKQSKGKLKRNVSKTRVQ